MNAIVARILSNKWFWITLVAIVLFLVLRGPLVRAWAALMRLTMKDGGDYTEEARGEDAEFEALAQRAYNELNAGVPSPVGREEALKALTLLNDTELRIAAKNYKLLSRDKSLYQAVDDAWMPFSDVDEELMGRLSNIAMI